MNANLQSVIRALLVAGGSWLVNTGYVSAEQWQSIVGALMALGAVAWAVYSNHQTKAANVVAAATGRPTVVPLVGVPTIATAVPTATGASDVSLAKLAQ